MPVRVHCPTPHDLIRRDRFGVGPHNLSTVSTHSTVRHVNASKVKVTQRHWSAHKSGDGVAIASGMHAVGGCALPGRAATTTMADSVAANKGGAPNHAAVIDIGAEMQIPAT